MKKTYIAPSVETIKVSAVNMLAASARLFDAEVNTSTPGVQLGRELTNGVKDLDLLWD